MARGETRHCKKCNRLDLISRLIDDVCAMCDKRWAPKEIRDKVEKEMT